MFNNKVNVLQENFKKECELINMKYEYSGYTGDKKWAIISDLSEEKILEKYRSLVSDYIPFIVLPLTFGQIRNDFRRNEKKHHMRATRSIDAFNFEDGKTEAYHSELVADNFEKQLFKNEEARALWRAIMMLKPIQRERLIKHYFEGKSSRKIAEEEGVAYSAVDKSIASAIKNLKKVLI